MRQTILSVVLGVLVWGWGISYGQDKDEKASGGIATMPEVVVTAPKESLHVSTTSAGALIPIDPVELPQSVEIIPQALLEDRYITSFYETLEQVSGVFSAGRSSFTVSSGKPTIRGFSGSDVMLGGLVLPARMPMFMDAEGMAGVEYYKGPLNSVQGGQSGLQGSGGAVNILPKTADFSNSFQRLSLGGMFGNGESARFTYDPNMRLTEDLALRIPFAASLDRPFYLPSDLDAGYGVFVSPSIKWQAGPDTVVTLLGSYQYSDKPAYQGIPYLKGNFLVPLDTYYGNDDTRDKYKGLTIQGRVDHRFTDKVRLSLGAGYARVDEARTHWSVNAGAPQGSGMTIAQYYDRIIATHTAPFSYMEGDYLDENFSAFAHLGYDLNLGPVSNQLVMGIDWLQRKTDARSRSGITPTWLDLDDPALVVPTLSPAFNQMESKVNRYGLVLQDFASWGIWRLLVGTRVDRHESDSGNYADSVSPRVGLTCLLQPDFAIYGNVTLAEGPNFGYKDINGDELTESWRSEQIEAGIKKRLIDDLWATLAVFQIIQKNTPQVDPLDPSGTSYICEGKNRSRGFEAGLNGELTENWNWWGSYTHLEYEDVDKGIDFERFPQNSLTLWTSYRLASGVLQGLRAAAGYRYAGKYYTTFRGAYINDEYEIDPAHVVDMAFEYPLPFFSRGKSATKLEMGVKNVFDEEYVESNRHGTENFPGQPRAIWTRLSTEF